jgi:hypothetical protein
MTSWTNTGSGTVVSLLSEGSLLPSGFAGTLIPGFNGITMPLTDVSGFASYDINLYGYALDAGAVGAAVTIQVTLQWFDDQTSGIPVFEEVWDIWAGRAATAANDTLSGSGPMHGRYMTAILSIPPTAAFNVTMQYVNIYGSNRIVPYSDWRQDGQTVQPETNGLAIIAGAGTATDNILGSFSNTPFLASTGYWLPMGMYSGPIYFRLAPSTPLMFAAIVACSYAISGALIAGAACPGILAELYAGGALTPYYANGAIGTVLAPRGPCALIFQTTATAPTISFMATAQQAA